MNNFKHVVGENDSTYELQHNDTVVVYAVKRDVGYLDVVNNVSMPSWPDVIDYILERERILKHHEARQDELAQYLSKQIDAINASAI